MMARKPYSRKRRPVGRSFHHHWQVERTVRRSQNLSARIVTTRWLSLFAADFIQTAQTCEANRDPVPNNNARLLVTGPKTAEKAIRLAAQGRAVEARVTYFAACDSDSGHEARIEFGCYLTRIECVDEAIEQFSRLLRSAQITGDSRLRALASHNLAAVYREQGRNEVAASWQQQSISAEIMHGPGTADEPQTACDLAGLANDALCKEEYPLAEELLFRSLQLEKAAGSLSGQAADWGSLGVVALLNGEIDVAVSRLWQAYRLHGRLDDVREAGCDLLNLAELALCCGQRRLAVRFLQRAQARLLQAAAAQSAQQAHRRLEELRQCRRPSRTDVD